MSQFMILREADQKYRIVFAVHHALWDKMSSLVLEDQIQSYLDGKKVVNHLPYAHYVASLNHEIVDVQVQGIKCSFVKLLQTYTLATQDNPILKLESSCLKLPDNLYENYHQLNIWDLLVHLVRVIAQENGLLTSQIKEIPIQIVQEGRNKLATDYSQSLGLFVDFAPLSISNEEDQQSASMTHRISYLDCLKKKNNLLWQEVFEAYSNELNAVLLVNYLGIYDVDFERMKKVMTNHLDLKAREITVTRHDDYLLVIYPVFQNTSNRIKQKLQEKINAYVHM